MKRCRKKKYKINYKRFTISLTILIILLLSFTNISKRILAHDEDIDEVEEHINLDEKLDNLPKKPVNLHRKVELEAEKKVDKVEENETIMDEKEDTNAANDSMDMDYKEIFKDSLFLGDSITDSLSFYEFLDESKVVAKFGLTAKGAKDMVDKITEENPNNIFIMFGMNDILIHEGSVRFAEDYAQLIHAIEEKLPEANIYVQSILPVDSKVKDKKSLLTNENIDEFNQALINMAEDEGVEYLDIRSILERDMDLLEPDGIHVKYGFYKLWLDYLRDNVMVKED